MYSVMHVKWIYEVNIKQPFQSLWERKYEDFISVASVVVKIIKPAAEKEQSSTDNNYRLNNKIYS